MDCVDASHLQTLLRQCDLDDMNSFCHLIPGLFVSFDSKAFFSYFPEPTHFENFAPDGWTSVYKPFFDLIPLKERYWIIDGRDLLFGLGKQS